MEKVVKQTRKQKYDERVVRLEKIAQQVKDRWNSETKEERNARILREIENDY